MVHKDKAGFIFSDKIHSFGGVGKFYLPKGGFNNDSDNRCKKFAGFSGRFVFKPRKFQHFLIAHFFDVYFQFGHILFRVNKVSIT